ncbi:MAG: hypothetical protein ABR595_05285, partial [Psychroflexus sp.]
KNFKMMARLIRIFALSIFIGLNLFLIASTLFENTDSVAVILGFALLSVFIVLAYNQHRSAEDSHLISDCQDAVYVCIGGVFTYFINTSFDLSAVIAAGSVGTIAAFLPDIFPKSKIAKRVPTPVYCGAFVGMTAPEVASGYSFIIFASLLTGILFIASKNILQGYGGKLGTLAFGGVVISTILTYIVL